MGFRRQTARNFRILLGSFVLLAMNLRCATVKDAVDEVDYPMHRQELLDPFRGRDFARTASLLAEGRERIGPDRLVFLLDSALAYHNLGDYRRSLELLWEANKLIEVRDFARPTEIKAANLVNTKWKLYHGEEFEAVLLHVYQSINFAFLGEWTAAVNEARAAEEVLTRIQQETGRKYTRQTFFHRWSAWMYENNRDFAAVAAELDRYHESIGITETSREERQRMSLQLRREDEIFGDLDKGEKEIRWRNLAKENRDNATVMVLLQNGYVPAKELDAENRELVRLRNVYRRYAKSHLYIDGVRVATSELVLDVAQLANENIQFQRQFWEKDKAAGFPTQESRINRWAEAKPTYRSYRLSDRTAYIEADLRQWATLPADLQIVRASVRLGGHRVSIRLESEDGRLSPFYDLGEIQARKAGQVFLFTHRALAEKK